MADSNSRDPQSAPVSRRNSPRGIFAPEIVDLFLPPLKVGGWSGTSHITIKQAKTVCSPTLSGTAGVLAGVGGSIFKEGNPVIWGAVSGFQWFTLGTSFWCKLSYRVDFFHDPSSQFSSHKEHHDSSMGW